MSRTPEPADPERPALPSAPEALAAMLYDELRTMARCALAGERADHTLQPTALVHEAYLRLLGKDASFESRAEFFGAAASAIRRVLVDHSRRRASLRRGGAWDRAPEGALAEEEAGRWLALDAALERLAALSPLRARIVELRFFADAANAEIARLLSVSESTVGREWRVARAWLRQELEGDGRDGR